MSELFLQRLHEIAIRSREQAISHLDHGDLRAKRGVHRTHFETNVATTHYQQFSGNVFQFERTGRIHHTRVADLKDGRHRGGGARPWVNTGSVNWSGGDITLENDAEIINEEGGSFTQLGTGNIQAGGYGGGTFTNAAYFNKTGPGITQIDAAFFQDGTVDIDQGELRIADGLTNYGLIDLAEDTAFRVLGEYFTNAPGATIQGAGTIGAPVSGLYNEGVIRPGTSPGHLTVEGDLALDPSSSLFLELQGPDPGDGYDWIEVSGDVILGGTLNVTLTGGYVPGGGDAFEVITSGGMTQGMFNAENLPAEPAESMVVLYRPQDVTLLVDDGQVRWDGDGMDFLWENPLNWLWDQVPTIEDSVTIGIAGDIVVVSANAVAGALVSDSPVSIESSLLTVGTDATFNAGLTLLGGPATGDGAALSVTGALTVNGDALTLIGGEGIGSGAAIFAEAVVVDVAGNIELTAGKGGGARIESGLQDLHAGNDIRITGGNGTESVLDATLTASGDQTVRADNDIVLTAAPEYPEDPVPNTGSFNIAEINGWGGTQTVWAGNDIELIGGASSGSHNEARIRGDGDGQAQSVTAGNRILIKGGTNGDFNSAGIWLTDSGELAGTQSVNAAQIHLEGGASGESNTAEIANDSGGFGQPPEEVRVPAFNVVGPGGQSITATDTATFGVRLDGGSGGADNIAEIRSAGETALTVDGLLSLNGGTGGTDQRARIVADVLTVTAGELEQTGGDPDHNEAWLEAFNGADIDIAGDVRLVAGGGRESDAEIIVWAGGLDMDVGGA